MPAPPPAPWSPLLDLIDMEPGQMWLAHTTSPVEHGGKLEPYGFVRLMRTKDGPRWRADYTRNGGRDWIPLGLFDGLVEAVSETYEAWKRSGAPNGGPAAYGLYSVRQNG